MKKSIWLQAHFGAALGKKLIYLIIYFNKLIYFRQYLIVK